MNKNECGEIIRKLIAIAQTRNLHYSPSVVVEIELGRVKDGGRVINGVGQCIGKSKWCNFISCM